MLHPSTKRLIDRLSEMTSQRKIEWAAGEHPDHLIYDTEGYRVLLEGQPAALVLCDALGSELERASPEALADAQHVDGGTYEAILETMREDAARIARGTEMAIASVLDGLHRQNEEAEGTEEPQSNPEDTQADEAPVTAPDTHEDSAGETDIGFLQDDNTEETDTETHAPEPVEPLGMDLGAVGDEDDREDEDTPQIDTEIDPVEENDTPDVGKAVAALADSMNADEAATPAKPRTVDPSGMNTLLRGGVMAGLTPASFTSLSVEPAEPRTGDDEVETRPAPLPTLEPIGITDPADITNEAPDTVNAPTVDASPPEDNSTRFMTAATIGAGPDELANPEQASQSDTQPSVSTAPKPGETLSLSGLATPLADDPLTAGTASIPFGASHTTTQLDTSPAGTEPSIADNGSSDRSEANDSLADIAMPELTEETQPDNAAASPDAETDEADATSKPANKRFNPWI